MMFPTRSLGDTGLRVPILTIGTAGLCQPYAGQPPPSQADAIRLIHMAYARGLDWFDTAPAYGSESLLREALGADGVVLTKVAANLTRPADVQASLSLSRQRLRRDVLDVQLHNATYDDLEHGCAVDVLLQAKHRGQVRLVGATVYDRNAVDAAYQRGLDFVQVPYNLLDQRFAAVMREHGGRGLGVFVRSVWLRGALTTEQAGVPSVVMLAANLARRTMWTSWKNLPTHALRFALAGPHVVSAVIGPRTPEELLTAVAAARRRMGWVRRWAAGSLVRIGEYTPYVIDPRQWDEGESDSGDAA